MKFYIDETSEHVLAANLHQLWPQHEFRTYADEQLSGMDDEPLLPEVARRGFDVFITQDRAQLQPRSREYHALYRSRLHWAGHKQVPVPGPPGIALRVAAVVAAFPHLLADIGRCAPGERLAVRMNLIPRERGQRVRSLLLTSDGPQPLNDRA